jgi:hypothetical protein
VSNIIKSGTSACSTRASTFNLAYSKLKPKWCLTWKSQSATYIALHILRTRSQNFLSICTQSTFNKSRASSIEGIPKWSGLRVGRRSWHPRLRSHIVIHFCTWEGEKSEQVCAEELLISIEYLLAESIKHWLLMDA